MDTGLPAYLRDPWVMVCACGYCRLSGKGLNLDWDTAIFRALAYSEVAETDPWRSLHGRRELTLSCVAVRLPRLARSDTSKLMALVRENCSENCCAAWWVLLSLARSARGLRRDARKHNRLLVVIRIPHDVLNTWRRYRTTSLDQDLL
jgi:hypothetical protein